jgi:hypothetical protein
MEDAGEGGAAATAEVDEPHDVIVAIRPDDASDPADASAQTKAVVISGETRRIIGYQG